MMKRNSLTTFVNGDQFELNSYLTYLFDQLYAEVKEQSEENSVELSTN